MDELKLTNASMEYSLRDKLHKLPPSVEGISDAEYSSALQLCDQKVNDLYKALTPRGKNFKEIQKVIEPYDDHDQLRKQPVLERMEVLR